MKKPFLIIYFFSVQLFFSQIVFQNEPIVRVRIINTVDTLRLLFNDKWLPSNGDSLIFSPADGEVMFTIEAGKNEAPRRKQRGIKLME